MVVQAKKDVHAKAPPPEDATAWHVRMDLAARGWTTELSILTHSRGGPLSFRATVKRWDWHGWRSNDVRFSEGLKVNLADPDGTLRGMRQALQHTARLALEAWATFPDKVPILVEGQGLVVNEGNTAYTYRENPRRMAPTEDLPLDIAGLCPREGAGDPTLSALLAIAALSQEGIVCHYSDDLHWRENAAGQRVPVGLRQPHFYEGRPWSFKTTISPVSWHGTDVALSNARKRDERTLSDLREVAAASQILTRRDTLADLARHYPGDVLPPGHLTITEHFVLQDEYLRRRLVGEYGDDAFSPTAQAEMLEMWTSNWERSEFLQASIPRPTLEIVQETVFSLLGEPSSSPGPG